MDYRPIPDDRTEQFRSYLRYAFEPERGPRDDSDEDDRQDRPGNPRGLFDGDDLLCVCHHHWLRARHRGRWTEMPGLSAVASPPEHRRKGHVARLLAESLEEYRDRGDYLTALWAFEHPFYERQGWGLANKYAEYECPPDALAFARREATRAVDGERTGEFRRVDADDWADLDSVFATHGERFDLAIDRTEEWWRKRVFDGWRSDPYVYAWDDDEGETRGYVVYRIEDEAGGKKLAAAELAHADREARLNLLRFLANHDSQVETVRVYGTEDARLLDEVADPAAVDCEIKPGPMVRLVDVQAAIEALEYPGIEGEFDLAVSDPLADWNDRRFRIEVEGGRATCEPVNADSDTTPDAEVGVSTLSQLYVGYHSVADAEAFGDLEVRTPAARETLAAMFPLREVFLPESF